MSNTGFTVERSAEHDKAVKLIVNSLNSRGYQAIDLRPDGHRPDIHVTDRITWGLDVKGRNGDPPCYSVAIEWLCAALTYHRPVLVAFVHHYGFADVAEAQVLTVLQCVRCITHGPRRRSGTGSLTDYVVVNPELYNERVKLWDFFPKRV
jgi:hypothetical protein